MHKIIGEDIFSFSELIEESGGCSLNYYTVGGLNCPKIKITIPEGKSEVEIHLGGWKSRCLFVCCLFHSGVRGLFGGGPLEELGRWADW